MSNVLSPQIVQFFPYKKMSEQIKIIMQCFPF